MARGCLGVLLWAWATPAGATAIAAELPTPPGPKVELRLGPCVAGADLVHDLVGVELGLERLVEIDGALVVTVECRGPALVVKLAPNPEQLLDRVVLREDQRGEGGPRLLALNIVELVQEAELRLETAPPSPPPLARTEQVQTHPSDPEAGSVAWWIGLGPQLTVRAGPGAPAYGLKLQGSLESTAQGGLPWVIHLDGGFDRSVTASTLGKVTLESWRGSALVGAAWHLPAAFTLLFTAGARVGWASLRAESDQAGVAVGGGTGGWWGPLGAARLRLGSGPAIGLGLEFGYTARPVYGQVPEGELGLRGAYGAIELVLELGGGGR